MKKLKNCGKCREAKPLSQFYKKQSYCVACQKSVHADWVKKNKEKVKKYTAERYAKNKEEMKAAVKQWRRKNPERLKATAAKWYAKNSDVSKNTARKSTLKNRYGLTPEDYEKLLKNQGGVCAVCKKKPSNVRLAVDHDHATKVVRGLLCSNHNTAIGLCSDSPEELRACANYLEQQRNILSQGNRA